MSFVGLLRRSAKSVSPAATVDAATPQRIRHSTIHYCKATAVYQPEENRERRHAGRRVLPLAWRDIRHRWWCFRWRGSHGALHTRHVSQIGFTCYPDMLLCITKWWVAMPSHGDDLRGVADASLRDLAAVGQHNPKPATRPLAVCALNLLCKGAGVDR